MRFQGRHLCAMDPAPNEQRLCRDRLAGSLHRQRDRSGRRRVGCRPRAIARHHAVRAVDSDGFETCRTIPDERAEPARHPTSKTSVYRRLRLAQGRDHRAVAHPRGTGPEVTKRPDNLQHTIFDDRGIRGESCVLRASRSFFGYTSLVEVRIKLPRYYYDLMLRDQRRTLERASMTSGQPHVSVRDHPAKTQSLDAECYAPSTTPAAITDMPLFLATFLPTTSAHRAKMLSASPAFLALILLRKLPDRTFIQGVSMESDHGLAKFRQAFGFRRGEILALR